MKDEFRKLKDYEEKIKEEAEEHGKSAATTGRWIRGYLIENGEDYIANMYKRYKKFVSVHLGRDPPSYQSFSRYMRQLRQHGLVEHVRSEPANGPAFLAPRKYYAINTEMIDELGENRWVELFDRPFND